MTSPPTDFVKRGLYGGAMSVSLPSKYIDGSDLRQVPDHQELFLSPTSLTSIIFEINEYQHPSTISTSAHSNVRRPSTSTADDEGASTHHLLDTVSAPDTLDPDSPGLTPRKTALLQPSLRPFPAYVQRATILSTDEPLRRRRRRESGSSDIGTDPPRTETRCYQILIRLRPHATDLCVRVHVPLRELKGTGTAAVDDDENDSGDGAARVRAEEKTAEAIVQSIVETLAVHDFGLFGAEE